MLSLLHETDSQTSRHDIFLIQYTELSARLYGISNFRGRERLVRTDVQTPGYMRAPYEHPAAFAVESLVDELAYCLGQDPVALRLANDATADPITCRPYSSRHLAECLRRGAARFGCDQRSMAPGSTRAADGSLVGWGVAIGAYKAATAPVIAKLRFTAEGAVAIGLGGHEMGQGICNTVVAIVQRRLGVEPGRITVEIGRTGLTPQHLTAGSWGTATVVPAADEACDALLRELEGPPNGPSPAERLRAAGRPFLEVEVRRRAPGQPEAVMQRLATGLPAAAGPAYPEFVSFSHVAHFVEVRIEPGTRRIRVPRVVSVTDCGRVVSPPHGSQPVAWRRGLGHRRGIAGGERGGPAPWRLPQRRYGRVCAPCACRNRQYRGRFCGCARSASEPAGVKGLGEVAMVGVPPAIANAVHHATGRRLRSLPIRVEDLL
jgi:xanthine dehydrogenase YagR molybdenum-binding subunit